MKGFQQVRIGLAAAVLGLCCVAVANAAPEGSAAAPQTMDSASRSGSAADASCSVHLWDGKHFSDADIVIHGPGNFDTLRDLPGANGKDWNDEADSLKVGSAATVTIWKKRGFKGTSATYRPGTDHPKLSDEPSSLKITCK